MKGVAIAAPRLVRAAKMIKRMSCIVLLSGRMGVDVGARSYESPRAPLFIEIHLLEI